MSMRSLWGSHLNHIEGGELMKIRICNRALMLLTCIMFFILLTASTNTFAYWDNMNNTGANNTIINIGSWDFGPNVPEGITYYDENVGYSPGNLVWYEGQLWEYKGNYTIGAEPSVANGWTTYNDFSWYANIIYRTGDIVFFNGNIYVSSYEHSNQNPETTGASGPWDNVLTDTISWSPGQDTELNEVVFYNGVIWIYRSYYTTTEPGTTNQWSVLGDINFSPNYVYANGDIVLYNGQYYTTNNGGWATGTTPGTNGAWTVITVTTFTNRAPNNAQFILYNGLLYKSLQTINGNKRNIVPGSAASKGVWNAINTQQWQQYNTYANGDLVMYQSNVFQLINSVNSSDIPGTTQNSWNGIETLNYVSTNAYVLNDYVVYNSNIYQVINETNANLYAPGTFANAWNQLNGYDWYWFNTYQTGDVVYYMDAVYVALQTTTNHQPDLVSSSIYWSLYEN